MSFARLFALGWRSTVAVREWNFAGAYGSQAALSDREPKMAVGVGRRDQRLGSLHQHQRQDAPGTTDLNQRYPSPSSAMCKGLRATWGCAPA